MPNLLSDIVGQVERLPLRPSEANALLPLFEAISNSLHAILEKYSDSGLAKYGRIDIHVIREKNENDTFPVIGFEVSDNGIGFNEENFQSFLTPYSRLKMKRGGKGIGRLGWLKVFSQITLDSKYDDDGELKNRTFDFILRESEQIVFKENGANKFTETGTNVLLKGFLDSYGGKCPSKIETINQRIIAHFLPIFAADQVPKIFVHDDGITNLKDEFDSKISHSDEVLIEIELNEEIHPIIVHHMRCDKSIRPRGGQNNWMCFCANQRGVHEYGIDEQIGLQSLNGEEIYVGTVTGDFLDDHVNTQRTDFIFDADDGRTIRRQVASSVKDFLREFVDESLAQKRAIAQNVINKNPQYIYLQSEMDDFIQDLQPNSNNEEKIYIEMSQNRYRRQRRFNNVKQDIENAPEYDDSIAEKVSDYQEYIQDDQKGALAEYVTRRKSVLDLLDRLRGFDKPDTETYSLEEAVHKLICPMRIDSHQLSIEDHNLWILDDRLAFFNFFASDRPISQFTDVESGREPDITAFYDSCFAWKLGDRSSDTVILIEFKRPGLNAYTDKNDPYLQLMDYVRLFQGGSTVKDRNGAVISGIGANTSFHCYIVADLTNGLKRRLQGRFLDTPDGKGMFGYQNNPDCYAEVIPYDKLLNDAHMRNAIFFDKLGLNG